MFIVVTTVTGPEYFLKGTIWTSAKETASRYASVEDAKAALARSAKFNPRAARKARIVEG